VAGDSVVTPLVMGALTSFVEAMLCWFGRRRLGDMPRAAVASSAGGGTCVARSTRDRDTWRTGIVKSTRTLLDFKRRIPALRALALVQDVRGEALLARGRGNREPKRRRATLGCARRSRLGRALDCVLAGGNARCR
jgi:hypothetical protein